MLRRPVYPKLHNNTPCNLIFVGITRIELAQNKLHFYAFVYAVNSSERLL